LKSAAKKSVSKSKLAPIEEAKQAINLAPVKVDHHEPARGRTPAKNIDKASVKK
jgi:hypothetical protein